LIKTAVGIGLHR